MLRDNILRMYGGGKSGLPVGYQECEWIESDGTNVIRTGIYPKASYTVECEWMCRYDAGLVTVFGCRNNTQDRFTCRGGSMTSSSNGFFQWSAGAGEEQNTYTGLTAWDFVNLWVSVKLGNEKYELNGESHDMVPVVNENAFSVPMAIFGVATTAVSESDIASHIRIRKFNIKDKDGNYVMNLIPALDTNGRPCMYDTVSKTPKYNARGNNFNYKLR